MVQMPVEHRKARERVPWTENSIEKVEITWKTLYDMGKQRMLLPEKHGEVTMMNKYVRILFVCMLAICICACGSSSGTGGTEPTTVVDWPGYQGTMDGYEYYHSEERDLAWEQDVIYMAETFMNNHAKLANKKFFTQYFMDYSGKVELDYSNMHYDEETRVKFLAAVNELIPQISKLSDSDIEYECERVIALLECAHSNVSKTYGDSLPLACVPIVEESETILCAVRVLEEHAKALGSKLVAINGVSAEEIIRRLSIYVPTENEYRPVYALNILYQPSRLMQANALSLIGVVGPEDRSAEITFENENGIFSLEMDFINPNNLFSENVVWLQHPVIREDFARNQNKEYYWYTVGEGECGEYLYVRFSKMAERSDYRLEQFIQDVRKTLTESETPMRLIIDFRSNSGGNTFPGPMNRFIQDINRCNTNGVYILINGGCFSAAMQVPFILSRNIEGAQLVGTPAGQPANTSAMAMTYTTPNNQMKFRVSDNYMYCDPGNDADSVYPDITVYQTWEEYQAGIDTVLEYVTTLE